MSTAEALPLNPASPPLAGRQAFLERKRHATRTSILLAAREVFAGATYVNARIEEILRVAGVSRATFYVHFDSKLALAFAIYDEIAPQTRALFGALAALPAERLEAIKEWLRAFVRLHVEHRYVTPLIAQLQQFEPSFRERILDDAEALIDQLAAAGVASFARAMGAEPLAIRQRARARLLLNRVAAVCADIARAEEDSPDLTDIYLDLVGLEMQQFLLE